MPVTVQFNVAFFPSTAEMFSTCSTADPSESEEKQSAASKLRVPVTKFYPADRYLAGLRCSTSNILMGAACFTSYYLGLLWSAALKYTWA